MKLNEGEIHDFQVIKLIEIPDEGEFYMLRHKSGRRLLIPCNTYNDYGIEVGQNIKCRIDKVSCTGKVYLEPEHPYYIENQEYEFDIIDTEQTEYGISALFVKDCIGNTVKVPISKEFKLPISRKINLKVEKLKKGIPLLSTKVDTDRNEELKSLFGSRIEFKVIGISKNDEQEDVYLLTTNNGHKAELKLKHYNYYNISIGMSINCEVYGYNYMGILKVEPENPFYKLDETYVFDLVKDGPNDFRSDEENEYYAVDKYGNKCGISFNSEIINTIKQKTRVECRVMGFRKGRPKLEVLRLVE